jgi:heptosyltransferase-2
MKIMIIKLGAKGDVVRTLPVIPALKEKYPQSEIYWITKENIADLFRGNSYITRVFSLPYKQGKENFDLLFNFDTEEQAMTIANQIKAEKKLGFKAEDGFPVAFNLGAEYYLNTMFDDELKKTNKKTYQEMMFNAAELEWKNQKPKIFLNDGEVKFGKDFLGKYKVGNHKIIGIHLGASPRWPSKAWHQEELKEFINLVDKENFKTILFGGPDEVEKHSKIIKELRDMGIQILQNNPHNTNREFFSLVNSCDVMICGDSFALHVALALNKPTIGLFFCTSPDEIEGYGLLKKIVSPKLYEFFPERMDEYSEELVRSIKASDVLKELKEMAG